MAQKKEHTPLMTGEQKTSGVPEVEEHKDQSVADGFGVQDNRTPMDRVAEMLSLVSGKDAQGTSMVNVRALVLEVMPTDQAEAEDFVKQARRMQDATSALVTFAQETLWARSTGR